MLLPEVTWFGFCLNPRNDSNSSLLAITAAGAFPPNLLLQQQLYVHVAHLYVKDEVCLTTFGPAGTTIMCIEIESNM